MSEPDVGTDTALSARAAGVARAIAVVLEARCTPESGAAGAAAFLREWAGSVTGAAGESAHDGQHPLATLSRRVGLSNDECDLVLLAGLPDEHEGIATTFRSIHPQGEPHPTLGLAALLLGGTPADRTRLRHVVTAGAGVRLGVIRTSGASTFFERSVTLGDGLWDALHGADGWPDALARIALPAPPPGLDGWLARDDVRRAVAVVRADRTAVVLVLSEDEAVAQARAAALCDAAGLPAVAARAGAGDRDRLAMLAAHAAVRGAVPVLVATAHLDGPPESLAVGEHGGVFVACVAPGAVRAATDRAVIALPADDVDITDQVAAWAAALPHLAQHAQLLAARHPLDPAVTAQLGLDARERMQDARERMQDGAAVPGFGPADVSALLRTRAAAALPLGVRLMTPDVPWCDVVLPAEGAAQLHAAIARLDNQHLVLDDWAMGSRAHATRGARLLLTGPPGTGKSLAAAAVATAAQTDLLVVDVSRVVSKWLGETEKNLAAAFAAAERTRAVLLLDEADALFATRTAISDAHDRYANLETAYLLQRLDRFDGLVILTTNLRANIDGAFLRRMDFVVEFPLPDPTARIALWAQHLPATELDSDIDLDALSRLYPVPGAWIRNAAIAGAFGAAETHAETAGAINQDHLVAAMRREYAKASLPFPGEPPRRRHDPV